MLEKWMQAVTTEHRGKTIGVLMGLTASLLFVTLGFWQTIFIILCIFAGYQIGKKIDENVDLEVWLKNFFNLFRAGK